ncbi:MAG: 16S rRNA pseudouridine(516) synthase, partial [Megasphaera sp.]|nr:16S rRNA pseudouridine(516) synthase [Megasphaera sp.]
DHTIAVVVEEGKFHQVKRMCAAVGLTVAALHRRSIGPVFLDEGLKPGEFRPLTEDERNSLSL